MSDILLEENASHLTAPCFRKSRSHNDNKIKRLLILAIVLFAVFSFLNIKKTAAKKDFFLEYSKLIDTLQVNGIEVSEQLRKRVTDYLNSEVAQKLISFSTDKPGTKWLFHKIIFIREDLILASYDDGEMYGGEILLKLYIKAESINMQTLWNSWK